MDRRLRHIRLGGKVQRARQGVGPLQARGSLRGPEGRFHRPKFQLSTELRGLRQLCHSAVTLFTSVHNRTGSESYDSIGNFDAHAGNAWLC
eukprot:2164665-Rhodomonas_salina.2